MSFPFIVFEGGDGTGKTSIARLVAKKLNALYLVTPGEPFNQIRENVEATVNPLSRFLYYSASVVAISDHIEKSLSQHPVICDRYIYSSVIGYSAMSGIQVRNIENSYSNLIKSVKSPNLTILLTVSREKQIERIKNRNSSKHPKTDFKTLNDPIFNYRVNQGYKTIAERDYWIIIDTSEKNPKEISKQILELPLFKEDEI